MPYESSLATRAPAGPLSAQDIQQMYAQQQGMGVPNLPPSLAMKMSRMGMNRGQNNPLLAATMVPPAQMPAEMPPFAPTPMAKPKEFYEQAYAPTEGMKANAMQDSAMASAPMGGIPGALPGQVPTQQLSQIPNDMSGFGLGANAPQLISAGGSLDTFALPQGYGQQMNKQDPAATGDVRNGLVSQLFDIYSQMYA